MTRRTLAAAFAGVLVAGAFLLPRAQPAFAQGRVAERPDGPADLILTNGKIITVDERFTIAQAVAVRGDHIVAVGTNQEISRLAGPATRRIDLRGRTVVPGLIDNHMHLLRYGTTWQYEVRWDGVESRKEALEMLRARTQTVKPGQWIYNLGGWAIEQFADDPKPFTREELDRVAPNHPVFLQASYYEAYLNSRALQLLGIDVERVPRSGPAVPEAPGVIRDAAGRPTGRISEEGFRGLVGKLPTASDQEIEASSLGMIRDLNRSGLTTFGSAGCEADLLQRYRQWADQGRLNIRVFCITSPGGGGGVDQLLPLHVHTNFEETIDAFLDQIEAVDKEYPVRNLRWVLAHFNQPTAAQIERMKKLGMYAAVTGKMVGGLKVLRQPISREDALIAHTRKNAYLVFQENNLGSIQPGKLADLLVIDRDYLTIPADQIKDIKPLMTMMGGRIVYDAGTETSTR